MPDLIIKTKFSVPSDVYHEDFRNLIPDIIFLPEEPRIVPVMAKG